jgi:ribosomal protein S15P/S13E
MPKKITKKPDKNSKKTLKPKKMPQAEFEKKVIALADKGLTSEKIGEELKQQEIHSKEYSKKISKILKEKDKYVNPDLKNVEEKLERVKKHNEKNKQDKRAKREKDRIFAQLRKLKKYFKVPIK